MGSRIQKSIKNAQVSMAFYVITLVLAFFSRRIFLQNLGTEFLGLSATLGDILNLMNITELGVGTAVGVTLYKPIFDNNHNKINEIISVFGYLYSRIGFIIASCGIILSCFFPLIFRDVDMPLWLVYFMFFAMLYSSLLGYFLNYRQILLSASQQNYVIRLRYDTINVVKILLQLATSFLPYCYIWWILMEVITLSVYSLVINRTLKKYYPWLKTSIEIGKAKFKDYRMLWSKTKQVFAFKISHLIFNGSINILISIFVSLSMVTMYVNYNMLMSKITNFFDGLFTGMVASIGNLIAEGNKQRIVELFFELMSIRYFVAGLCSITLYFTVPRIIVFWIGEQYLLPNLILILMSVHVFILQARLTVTNFKDAYGLFNDVWAPITEVAISVGLSLLLGKQYGIVGILIAFASADLIIKMFWQPYYLCKKGLGISALRVYAPVFVKYIVLLFVSFVAIYYADGVIYRAFPEKSLLNSLIYCVCVGSLVLAVLCLLFWTLDEHFRCFVRHMLSFRRQLTNQ